MDPISITTGVVGMLDVISRLSMAISRFKHDYKIADEDLNVAMNHVLLLRQEIRGLESINCPSYSPISTNPKGQGDSDPAPAALFAKAVSTARGLLCDIEAAFPLRSEPHTWKSKVRWALKDKQALAQLKERLHSAESTLQGIVSLEQLRVSRVIYAVLLQQQSTIDKIGKGERSSENVINMAMINQTNLESTNGTITKRPAQVITTPTKTLPRKIRFEGRGLSIQLVAVTKDEGTRYRAAAHISLFGKRYSVQFQRTPSFSFDWVLRVRNIIPTDSDMAIACRAGDFHRVRTLLANGLTHGNDVTPSGWPMLDYAINSGSARLVRLLLDHGADLDAGYGEHSMTALQSSFLRGNLDIARILITRGADIEYVDSDGYSVLSYLWVVDGRMEKSVDFMRLCLANAFSEVNQCDSRGWTAFHRAAAVGTREDVEDFLRLGASLDLRAEWYGWTALFFAASHDNVEAFQTIVQHSGPNVYESLDGDGWNLLHCCIYFGASSVMRIVLENGIDLHQKTLPSPLPEDPELSYRELTASDIACYIGPNRYQMFLDALVDTGRDAELEGCDDIFWDAADSADKLETDSKETSTIYGAEDVDDDSWTLLHWASYNGSPKVKKLLLLKGADPEHLEAIMLENNPTILPTSPFEGR
ncbi:ankyrin repeat-containing domain protein [Annulohypoxylon stygium]|nr:ankyrin repeat-containing domain protein [Annulohypoxylon stygium]